MRDGVILQAIENKKAKDTTLSIKKNVKNVALKEKINNLAWKIR